MNHSETPGSGISSNSSDIIQDAAVAAASAARDFRDYPSKYAASEALHALKKLLRIRSNDAAQLQTALTAARIILDHIHETFLGIEDL